MIPFVSPHESHRSPDGGVQPKMPALLLLLAASGLIAEEVRIPAADGFQLRGVFEAGRAAGGAVLLLHQCNREGMATGWEPVIPELRRRGLSVLSVDYRGYGGSRTGRPEEENVKHFAADVDAAFRYLARRSRAAKFAVVGASCGCRRGAAVAAANPEQVRALVCLSGSVGRPSPDATFGRILDLPVLTAAAEKDEPWATQMRGVFERARHPASRLLLYKGEAHGSPLFQQDPQLPGAIAAWVAERLQ